MRKRILSLTVVFAMILTFIPAFSLTASAAEFVGSGGNGTEDEPYLISNLDDLEAFRDYINADDDGGKDEYFKLTANIDMSDKYGSGGTSWTPIGTFSTGFNGEFDGAGHTVKVSLLYTDSTVNYIGLFGTVGSYISDGDGAIRNLGVSGSINSTAAVTAIGGIVGQNSGHGRIESCYSSVNINGKGSIGGIAGTNVLGSITNCYNTGNITNSSTRNDEGTGGIVGYNYEAIMSCYNTGKITLAEGGAASVGGIAGTHEQGIIENCYYLTGTAEKGISGTDDAVGTVDEKNTEEFKTLADDLNDGWGDAWKDSSFLGRPVFTAFPECGDGKEATPYTVPDKATLEKVRDYINDGGGRGEYFQQTADINLDGNDGNPWTPIGTGTNQFQGTFDGGGFTISGLYVNSGDYAGLFGQSYGTIKNLTVSGSVSGNGEVGGIVGENYGGVISDCRSDCAVSGSGNYVGGIAGYHTGTIKNCYNTGTVNGGTSGDNDYVGGIAGNNDGSIENCHNAGAITGTGNCTGGIVGENKNRGSIKNCYNTGTVNGVFDTGGIAGNNDGAGVESCYNTGTVSGSSTIGGIVGNTTGSIKNCYYLDSCGAAGEGTSKTADAFNSGEVTWLLQNGQGTQMWGQKLGDDSYPILTSDTDKKVCKVTFMTDDAEHAARYANSNGTVTLPENPSKANYTFERWSQSKDADGEKFDASTSVTEDMTVYAVGRDHFGGDSADITRSETYGYADAITVNLDNYMEYTNMSVASEGKFEYSIESDENSTSASISENTLTVPTGLDVGDYTITVKATEKTPQYSLMSVDSYGTEDVTLTVSVSIAKAASSVVSAPAAKDLTYTGNPLELVTAGTATGGELQYSTDGESYSPDVPTGTNADTYTVWYKVVGDENHNDTEPQSVEVTIKKAASTATVTPQDLTYTGEAQELVTGEATGGELQYSIDGESYSPDIPKGTNADTYTVWYKVNGDENHNDSAPQSVDVTIKKTAPTVTVTANDLHYIGVAQELVTGEVVGGTLQYSKSEDGDYSSDIPTETEVGTYTIWYKVVGDDNHTDLAPQSIQTEIKKSASVTDVDNAEVTYGDKLTLTATVSKKPFDGISLAALADKVDFYLGETPLGSADVIYTDTELKDSGTATLEITADKRFAVGANTIRAEYGGSIDLAGSEKDSIIVTVNKKTLEYSVSAEGKVYDENTAIDVTLTPTNSGEDDVTLTAKGAVSSPNAGSYGKVNLTEIAIGGDDAQYYSVDAEKSGVDLTSDVEIAKAEGTASVTMADYKCGDESVNPVPSSDTNGTGSVTYSYAAKGTDEYSEVKPLTAGEYTVRAVFAATDNYAELAVTDDFTVSHEYSADWKNNGNSHWHECVCGAKSDEAVHEAVIDAAIPATCTDTGKTEGSHCDVCGYVITAQTETDALGHSYGAWIITIDPTQTAAGKAKRVCALDSEHQETTDVPALIDGSWIKGERQEPTETEEGYQKYTSDEFGGFTEVLPALNAPPTYGVRGTTFDSDGNPKAGVHVVLKQGNTIFGSQDGVVSDEAGEFKFVGVGAGVYNIIAEFTEADETVTVTEMVVITDSDVDNVEVRLPTAKANSILIVEKDNDTPDVVVGGLDSVASDEASDIPDTSHVTVTMTIENQPADSENAEQREIDEICDNANINFIDIALVKQIDNGVAENIRETRKQLTIVIPFDTENKNNITVYRYHGGEATALAKTAEQGDCFTVGNGYVTIYTSKFSTYAIGYDESPSPSSYSGGSSSYMVRFETNGGSDVASQRISRNGVVKEPTAPTKDGYTFAGWYTDKVLTTEYDFASKVTSGFTLYAKWNEDKTDDKTEATPAPTDEPQPTAKSMPFTDVNKGDWFYNNVQYVYENGLMNGVSGTEFAPNETITRGMFVTILYRMEGEPSTGASTFADVPSNAYYANAVAWASTNGIVKGYSDTEYAPDDAVTREQAAAILFRYAAYKGESPTGAWAIQLDYPDIAEISDWAAEGVMFCTMKDIMAGRDSGEFDPQSDITRAEGAAVFERYLNMAE